jgi:hypothetical protein
MELLIIGAFCLGLFLIIYPYLALSKIWSLLEKIEAHNKSINDKLVELLKKEIE